MPAEKRPLPLADSSVSPPSVRRKVESATTRKAVANFFTPVSKKEPEPVAWRIVDQSLLVGKYTPKNTSIITNLPKKRRKIAAFDLDQDSTLIKPSSGKKFAKDAADWKWWHSKIPATLKDLYNDGYETDLIGFFQVIIVSNQGRISLRSEPQSLKSDQRQVTQFKSKVGSVLKQLDLPISVYAATQRDKYRKPRLGMWKEMLDDYDLDVGEGVDLDNSMLVGDAGGRPAGVDRKADFSCSDRNFAENIGIVFKTPEEFFLGERPQPFTRKFNPKDLLNTEVTESEPVQFIKKHPVEVVILCGSPGAGKSTFYWNYLEPLGYERVNQDTLKSRDKCVKQAKLCLSDAKAVVVDNTNADLATRSVWVKLAQELKIPVRCVYFTASVGLGEHNDVVRALNVDLMNPEKRTALPAMAFTGFAYRFTEPKLEEGFEDIMKIDFQVHCCSEVQAIFDLTRHIKRSPTAGKPPGVYLEIAPTSGSTIAAYIITPEMIPGRWESSVATWKCRVDQKA
ncbi:MAG: hypothetical protein M1834_003317 [Cirrosporium novae-zelandiae]|nr:MAG: hypothetical protein M1834_003317 [Cirrosporium novae-zelandiae]